MSKSASRKNVVTVYKNKDKSRFVSTWKNQDNIWKVPLGNRIILIGSTSTGKSNNIRNILEKSGNYHKVYLIAPETNQEYDWIGNRLRKYSVQNPPPFERITKHINNVVIIDDTDIAGSSKTFQDWVKELFTHVSSHNGTRVILSTHNYSSIPTTIRRCASLFFIHQSPDLHLIKTQIFQKLGAKPHEVDMLFELMKDQFSNIVIDLIPGTKSKYRLNNITPIDLKQLKKNELEQ